jgi:hypothetical protein
MRIGLLGPAEGNVALLGAAAEFLLRTKEADQVLYLGADDGAELVTRKLSAALLGGDDADDSFLTQAVGAATSDEVRRVRELLAREESVRRFHALRKLPPAPARAVEIFDDKVVLFVHDKATLDAEDIANAALLVYGKSKVPALNRFGPRAFFTPGPLRSGVIALLEREPDGNIALSQFEPDTKVLRCRDLLLAHHARMVVLS